MNVLFFIQIRYQAKIGNPYKPMKFECNTCEVHPGLKLNYYEEPSVMSRCQFRYIPSDANGNYLWRVFFTSTTSWLAVMFVKPKYPLILLHNRCTYHKVGIKCVLFLRNIFIVKKNSDKDVYICTQQAR